MEEVPYACMEEVLRACMEKVPRVCMQEVPRAGTKACSTAWHAACCMAHGACKGAQLCVCDRLGRILVAHSWPVKMGLMQLAC
eukprot:364590-Chlamydomonas_euryale.AAC.3